MDGLIFVSYFFDFIFTQNLLPQLFLLYTVYLLINELTDFGVRGDSPIYP